MARRKFVQIENKNALIELLEEKKPIQRILLANNAYKDDKTKTIVSLAQELGIPLEKVARKNISRRSKTSSAESVIGLMEVENMMSLPEMMDDIYDKGEEPFILLFSDIKYPQNIAAIFRTAFAAGVNGIITPVQKGNILSDEVIRISMGACLRIPIVEMSMFAAIKDLQKEGIEVSAVHMEGEPIYDKVMVGPKALILGSEDVGVSSKLLERADSHISIPMQPGLGSLNVSVSAALVMYEKFRQERIYQKMKSE
jgi:23S rRNA (guanosine2251-2'-O)-methyltransferase